MLFTENENKMKIVVLTGSPRHNGNTNYLADRFIAGAQEKGHTVFRFDCAARKWQAAWRAIAAAWTGIAY